MENVNNSYFDGYYKDIWRSIIPSEITTKEVDFIQQFFNIQPESKVLDLMCGYGRHTIALAKKGVFLTAVDNLEVYTKEIERIVNKEGLSIKVFSSNVINFETREIFDLAICMGNSICFFDRNETLALLQKTSAHLKTGGHILINTWMLAEIAFNNFRERSWSNIGELKFITESKYLLQPSRIETEHLIIGPGGELETKKAVDYIYSIAETEQLLIEAGFVMKEVYSIPGKRKFVLGDPRAYIIAEKK